MLSRLHDATLASGFVYVRRMLASILVDIQTWRILGQVVRDSKFRDMMGSRSSAAPTYRPKYMGGAPKFSGAPCEVSGANRPRYWPADPL